MTAASTDILDAAIRALSASWDEYGRRFVSLPVQYPSGALTTLDVSIGKAEAHITDMGLGKIEASTLCEDTSYERHATYEANARGLAFDSGFIIARRISIDLLPSALIAVANASACAAHAAIRQDREKKDESRRDAIYQKVRLAFPAAEIHRTLNVSGGRAVWDVHNVVDLRDNRKAIFEPVSNHVLSVATKFTMFSDLITRGDLILNAVFSDPSNLDAKSQMLREVANIVGIDDSIEAYREKAAA